MINSDLRGYLNKLSFRNNTNLRPEGINIPFSQEMFDEYAKCMVEPIYFIRNYVKVVNLDRGVVNMDLYPYQEKMVNAFHDNRKIICLTPRQYGKTITAASYLLHYIIFNNDKTVAILANKQATADEILHRVRLAYESLPKWIQSGVCAWNKRSIEIENGSRIFCAATSSSGIRGKSINMLMLDEIGFVENNLAEEFFTSVYPTLSSSKDSKIILTSTPNGYNHFYKFWNEAQQGINGFFPVKVEWTDMPGRTIDWYNDQKLVLGELKAAQELDCTFLGSSKTLLTGATLASLSFKVPLSTPTGKFHGMSIYDNPIKGHKYAMTVDVSRGRHMDSSAFMIFDVTEYPHRIAVSYNNNEISPLEYAGLIYQFAKMYNEAYALIEINDVGAQVADELFYTYEYENLFWTKSGDELGKKGTDPYPGIRTTKKTKRIGCSNLKDIIEKGQLIVDDMLAIQELAVFIQSKSGSYEADDGFHDDAVMCLVLFAWLVTQTWFNDLFDVSMRNRMYENLVKQLEDEYMLIGEFSNGLDDHQDEWSEGLSLLR